MSHHNYYLGMYNLYRYTKSNGNVFFSFHKNVFVLFTSKCSYIGKMYASSYYAKI